VIELDGSPLENWTCLRTLRGQVFSLDAASHRPQAPTFALIARAAPPRWHGDIAAGPSLKSWGWVHDEAEGAPERRLGGSFQGLGAKTKGVSDMVSASSIVLAWH